MSTPPRARFGVDASPSTQETSDYDVPAEDAGLSAEYTLPPPDPTILPPVVTVTSTQEWVPDPLVSSFSIHPTLAGLSTDALMVHASTIANAEWPATNPKTNAVVIHGDGLPWPLRVSPTGDSTCVTLRNVVESLRAFLTGAASDEDFASTTNPDAVTRAFHTRIRGNPDLRNRGTIRADYLPGPIVGLRPIANKGDAAFELVFPASRRRS